MLKTMGISIRKHLGDKAMANPALARRKKSKHAGRIASALFFLLGATVVAGLTWVGYKYYLLPRGLRYKSPDHAMLKPSGLWGHGIGILATMFMLLNFVYPMRKRFKIFKGKGSIVPWLRFHVFVGVMSPIVILFHTAFQWGNQLATTTYFSVLIVFVTGLIGRFIYGWVRLDTEEVKDAGRLAKVLKEFSEAVPSEWREHARTKDPRLQHLFNFAGGDLKPPKSLPGLLVHAPAEGVRIRRGLHSARRLFLERAAYKTFREQVQEARRLGVKVAFHKQLKKLMQIWRSLHVVLAVVLLGLIATHVLVSVRVGFRWIWK